MNVKYTAEATSVGGRRGSVSTSDGMLHLQLGPPKVSGGSGEHTNPEQLFAAGYSACFASAISVVARSQKLELGSHTVTVRVHLGTDESGRYGLAVDIWAAFDDLDLEIAASVVHAAHTTTCPYSRAIDGNVPVSISVSSHGADDRADLRSWRLLTAIPPRSLPEGAAT